jgi:low affinity Fe/Cu permease
MKKQPADHSASPSAVRRLNTALENFSHYATAWTGTTWAFAVAATVIVIWFITGPIFRFSDTWQLVINTGTTIITFLMVFLIQRSQNKDALAIQVKLDELLASQQGASNRLINVEDWSEAEIAALHKRFTELSKRLQNTSDECASHSITEAQEAVEAVAEELGQTHQARDRTPVTAPRPR